MNQKDNPRFEHHRTARIIFELKSYPTNDLRLWTVFETSIVFAMALGLRMNSTNKFPSRIPRYACPLARRNRHPIRHSDKSE
jgi:hypothetical protein